VLKPTLTLSTIRLFIAFGNSLGAIFAGLISHATPNWRWIFWMDTIVTGVLFALMLFAMPETNFERPVTTEMGETADLAPVLTQEKRSHMSYWQSLKVTAYYDR
jgi:MFS family permease